MKYSKSSMAFRRKPEFMNTGDAGPWLSPGRRKKLHQNDEKRLDETFALCGLLGYLKNPPMPGTHLILGTLLKTDPELKGLGSDGTKDT
jgi:hypothetical protein